MATCLVNFCKHKNLPVDKRPAHYPKDLCFFLLTNGPRRMEWLKAIRRDSETNLSPTNLICSIHFREEDILQHSSGKKYVKAGALPCKLLKPSELIQSPKMFQVAKLNKKESDSLNGAVPEQPDPFRDARPPPPLVLIRPLKSETDLNGREDSKVFADPIQYIPHNLISPTASVYTTNSNDATENQISIKYEDIKIEEEELILSHDELDQGGDVDFVQENLNQSINNNTQCICKLQLPNKIYDKTVAGDQRNEPIVDAVEVEEELFVDHFDAASRVQVSYLAAADTAKEKLLKRKLQQMAEADITKSAKIRKLTDIIWAQQKLIDKLKLEQRSNGLVKNEVQNQFWNFSI